MADIRIVPALGAINVTGSADFRGDSASTVLYVSGSGNVGVGTSNPISKLHVAGAVKATATTGHVLGTSTDTGRALSILNSGLAHGESYSVALGYANNSNNQAEITYYLVATGSTSNRLSLGLYNSSDTLNVVGTGNVGIGTVSPASGYKLDVAGSVLAQVASGNVSFVVSTNNANGAMNAIAGSGLEIATDGTNQNILFRTGASTRMRISSTGAVRLHSYGTGANTGTAAYNLSVDSSGNIIETPNPAAGVVDGSGTANYISKWSDSDTLTDSVIYDNGTNVGIGTTSPTRKLHVLSADDTRGIMVEQTLASSYAEVHLKANREYRVGTGGSTSAAEAANNWYVYDATAAAQRLVINSSGNVGIGITNPGYKLDIAGTQRIRVQNSSNAGIMFREGTTDRYSVASANGNFQVYDEVATTNRLFITGSTGNVGIGNLSPAYKLDVTGNARFTSNVYLDSDNYSVGGLYFDRGSSDFSTYVRANGYPGGGYANSAGTKYWLEVGGKGGVHVVLNTDGGAGDVENAYDHFTVWQGSNQGDRLFYVTNVGNVTAAGDLTVSGKITAREFHTTFVSASIIYQSGSTKFGDSADDIHSFTGAIGLNGSDSNFPFFVTDSSTATGRYNLANKGMGFNLADDYAQLQLYGANGGYIDFANAAEDYDARLIYFGGTRLELVYGKNIAITGTGVGIGVTNPSYHSHIYNNADIWHTAIGGDTGILRIGGQTNAGAVIQAFNPSTSAVRDLYLQRDGGSVGIGTNSPSSPLHVVGAGGNGTATLILTSAASDIFNWASSANYANLATGETVIHLFGKANSTNNQAYVGYRHVSDGSTGNMLSMGMYGQDYLMNITAAGNVGIGNTNPAYKLDVSGTGYFSGLLTANANLYISNNGGNIYFDRPNGATVGAIGWHSDDFFYVAGHPSYGPTAGNEVRVYGFGSNLHLGNSAAGDVATVTTGGRVGIGTNNPSFKLHVVSAGNSAGAVAAFTGTSTSGSISIGHSSNGGYIGYGNIGAGAASNVFYVTTGAGTIGSGIVMDNDGKVGIGTTSPDQELHIKVSSGNADVRLTGPTATNYTDFYRGDSAGGVFVYGNTDFSIGTNAGGGSNMFVADVSTGFIGIGTSGPVSRFHVGAEVIDDNNYSYDANTLITVHQTPTSTTTLNDPKEVLMLARQGTGGEAYGAAATFDLSRYENAGTSNVGSRTRLDFRLAHNDFLTTSTRVMTLLSSGNVGIGTTNPTFSALTGNTARGLHIQNVGNDTQASLRLTGHNNTGSPGQATFTELLHAGGDLRFDINHNGTTVLTINPSSNVGIGVTSPAYKLDVNGTIRGTGLINTGTSTLASQVVIAGNTNSAGTSMYDAYLDGGSSYFQAPPTLIRMDSSATGGIDEAPVALFIHNEDGTNNTWTKISLGAREAAGAGNSVSIAGIAAQKTSGTANAWASGDLHLWTKSGPDQISNMVLKAGGSVGIGTSSPNQRLSVDGGSIILNYGNAAANYYFLINKKTGQDGGILFQRDNGNEWQLVNGNTTGDLIFYSYGTSTEAITFKKATGYVGIGITSPSSTLHVSGSNPRISIGKIEAGSNNSGVYDSDHIIVGVGGSISIGAERRGDWALDATTATSTTFRSRVNIWSDNEDHVTFGGASTHIVTAWEDFKIWINNDSADAGILHLYNKSGKTEFARFSGGGDSWLNGGNVGIGNTGPNGALAFNDDVRTRKIVLWDGAANNDYQFYGFGVESSTFINSIYDVTDRYLWTAGVNTGARSEIMVLKGDGNLGLGTSTPTYKLQVNGTAYINETLYVNGIATIEDRLESIYDMFTGNSDTELEASTSVYGNINFRGITAQGAGSTATTQQGITWQINNYGGTTNYGNQAQLVVGNNGNVGTFMGFFTSDNYGAAPVERLRIQYNGNVGIGLTNPSGKLHVTAAGGDGSAILRITGTASDSFNWASSTVYANLTAGETALHQIGKAESQYNSGHYGYRHVADNSSSNMMTIGMFQADYLVNILGTGNVGIGITTPGQKLEVNGITKSGIAGNSSANYAALAVASAGTATTQAAIAIQQLTSEGDTIIFGDYEPYVEYNFMHENSSNVFHIHSGGNTNSLGSNTFYNRSGNARTGYIKWSLYQDSGNMLVGGSVGIGTTNPLQKLHVIGAVVGGATGTTGAPNPTGVTTQLAFEARSTGAGNEPSIAYHKEGIYTMYLQGQNSPRGLRLYSPTGESTANFYVQGDVVAYYSSDKRFKDNLSPITDALAKVNKLTGYEFDWNENQSTYTGHDYGVVAQEVEEVLPELVQTREDGYKAVKYEKLVAVLIEGIKEQQTHIQTLEDRISVLEELLRQKL